jgi:hypothetical protein
VINNLKRWQSGEKVRNLKKRGKIDLVEEEISRKLYFLFQREIIMTG